jgi:hypothetical protein
LGIIFFLLLFRLSVDQKINFRYKEEETPALLLHLPKLFAETAILYSAAGLSRLLVVASPQATAEKTAVF